jgi:predicted TIM-barrel fold metal-dependent hydrolase
LYDPEIYRHAVEIAGVDKILFGSDFPLLKPARYFKEFENAGLTQTQIDAVSGLNAAKLLQLLP